MSQLQDLKEELLLMIAESLDNKRDVLTFRLTCKSFGRVGATSLAQRINALCVTCYPESMKNFFLVRTSTSFYTEKNYQLTDMQSPDTRQTRQRSHLHPQILLY